MALIPKLASELLRELEGRGAGQRVHCGKLPSPSLLNIQQHIHKHVYTQRSPLPSLSVLKTAEGSASIQILC